MYKLSFTAGILHNTENIIHTSASNVKCRYVRVKFWTNPLFLLVHRSIRKVVTQRIREVIKFWHFDWLIHYALWSYHHHHHHRSKLSKRLRYWEWNISVPVTPSSSQFSGSALVTSQVPRQRTWLVLPLLATRQFLRSTIQCKSVQCSAMRPPAPKYRIPLSPEFHLKQLNQLLRL